MAELPEIERSVFVECALQLAVAVRKHCSVAQNADERWVGEARIRESRQACDLLVALGLLRWMDGLGYLWTVENHDLRGHLETTNPTLLCSIENVVGTCVVFCSFHGYVSDRREPFEVAGAFSPAMWSLVRAGYASHQPSGFKWTDKIAPIMIEQGLWTHEDSPLSVGSGEPLADKIWKAIPPWRRYWLSKRLTGMGRSRFFNYLSRRWTGDRLAYFEIPSPKSADEWRIVSAELPIAADKIYDQLVAIRLGQTD